MILFVVVVVVWQDVAIKVYLGQDYDEGTLLDYKKEVKLYIIWDFLNHKQRWVNFHSVISQIGIMRKLRHPNVLLFMGACYSHERLAIVTEFLPR